MNLFSFADERITDDETIGFVIENRPPRCVNAPCEDTAKLVVLESDSEE